MSRGYDFDERDEDRAGQENPKRVVNNFGRAGRPSAPEKSFAERSRDRRGINERRSLQRIERLSRLSDRERGTLREIGRFRTVSSEALLKHRYNGMADAMRKEIGRLQQQGLLQGGPFPLARSGIRSWLWPSQERVRS